MSTIDDVNQVHEIIENDGWNEDDPRVFQIVKYINNWNNITYGLTWAYESEERKHRYEIETDFVKQPKIIWRANDERYQQKD